MGRGPDLSPPAAVARLLRDADEEERRLERARGGAFDTFISSDYLAVWAALEAVPVDGRSFLEWGSGLGVIATMAALRGFDAYGIELQAPLVERARDLAARHGGAPTFAVGSFFPEDDEGDPALLDDDLIHGGEGADGYRALGVPLEEFDVIYGFPWPGEEELFLDLFRRRAGGHATLLLNLGRDGVRTVTR